MESNSPSHGVESVLREIDAVEQQLAGHLASAKKIKARMVKAKKEIAKSSPVTRLTSLIADLKAMPRTPALDHQQLVSDFERLLRPLAESYGGNLKTELHRQCELNHLAFRLLEDSIGVGPFALTIDTTKEVAALSYAKVQVAKDLPLDVATILKAVQQLSEKLLQLGAYSTLRNQIEEAMKVSLIRQRKAIPQGELRAELPAVYREMTFIRQSQSAKTGSDYPLPKFVVDLKALVQANENTTGDRRFRLETAVLENTKDSRKSIFVPKDVSLGYGEGTYYQAIVLTASA